MNLRDSQNGLAAAIVNGPKAIVPGLFAGQAKQVLRGLKVHANTISHARLMALEESFPQTRTLLGESEFNLLSRAFLDAGHGADASLDTLGEKFSGWLECAQVEPLAATLAAFEWLWLESYRAADMASFDIGDFAQLDAPGVLRLVLERHPAAVLVEDRHGLGAAIGIAGEGEHLLIARPDAEVLVYRIDDADACLFGLFDQAKTLGDIFETFCTGQPNNLVLPAMQNLLAWGALTMKEGIC